MGKRRREQDGAEGGQRVKAGDVLEVSVERIVPGGAGLAHAVGLTLFVPLAAPGDRLRVRVERVKGRVGFAALVEVVEPGASRVEPPCPYFGRCGGCDFQQLTYEAQLRAKVEIVSDCLRRIARLAPPSEIRITPSPAAWRYRSRARWQHDAQHRRLGYYELASHRVCDVAECPVVLPEVQDALTRLRAALIQRGPHEDSPRTSGSSETVDDGRAADETATGRARDHADAEFQAVAGDDGVSLLPPLAEEDTRERTRTVGGEHYAFDADCFFQINHSLLEPLVAEALKGTRGTPGDEPGATEDARAASEVVLGTTEGARGAPEEMRGAPGEMRGGTAVDLYCGVGLFTLPLARRFARVHGVEGNAAAAAFARRNLSGAGLVNASVETAPVADWLLRRARSLAPADFLLLDPPRAGAAEAVEGILRQRPRRIAYVSCDPATLARDLRALCADDYSLDFVTAFDMFPQTHHVETVARLSRRD
jgi:23S rRNA (uracil1939-C5)-methyltransferase